MSAIQRKLDSFDFNRKKLDALIKRTKQFNDTFRGTYAKDYSHDDVESFLWSDVELKKIKQEIRTRKHTRFCWKSRPSKKVALFGVEAVEVVHRPEALSKVPPIREGQRGGADWRLGSREDSVRLAYTSVASL